MEKDKLDETISQALMGDSGALEKVLLEVQDLIFNLSLRMLGSVADAEDATQDILIRIVTHLSSFQGKSAFKTWVYRIATNYLIDYKKSMFSEHPLDFDFYSNDIKLGYVDDVEEIMMGVSREQLADELKLSCTNVLLQCLDPQTRCIFILGTMFKIDSKIAGEILDISPDNYRQKLSRARKKVGDFLATHCGLTETGFCCCKKRVEYAIQQHRLNPENLEFQKLKVLNNDLLFEYKDAMENIDDQTLIFEELPNYKAPVECKAFINNLLQSENMKKIMNFKSGETYD